MGVNHRTPDSTKLARCLPAKFNFNHSTPEITKMPLVAAPAAAAQATRKPSLKEQPSYLKEVSVALHRGEELKKLKERLSAAKLIMDKDPSAKPWMLSRSISNSSLGAKSAGSIKTRPRSVSRESSSDDSL